MSRPADRISASDLLVIGLGATGRLALDAARDAGANATGIDRIPPTEDGCGDDCEYNVRAWAIFADGTIACSSHDESWVSTPKAIIIATGGLDLPLPLPGWELPGVTGAYRACQVLENGANVVVLRGPHASLGNRTPDLSRFNIVKDYSLADGAPVSVHGTLAVESVQIGDTMTDTHHVLLDNGLQPENSLARMTGLPTHFSAVAGGDVIVTGSVIAAQGTLLSVVGDAAGISGVDDATFTAASQTGRMLAEAILGGPIPVSIPKRRPPWPEGGVPLLPSQTTDTTLVCPDEGITVGMIREAIARGASTVNDVKRRTRAAMAICQGRDCLWTIRALLAEAGRPHSVPMTARPPVVGITVGELAALYHH